MIRLDSIAVGLLLFISSKSLLFRHEARDHNAKMAAYHSPVLNFSSGQCLCQSYWDRLVIATNGSGLEKTSEEKRLNMSSGTL